MTVCELRGFPAEELLVIFHGIGISTVRVVVPSTQEKRTWLAARIQFLTSLAPADNPYRLVDVSVTLTALRTLPSGLMSLLLVRVPTVLPWSVAMTPDPPDAAVGIVQPGDHVW